MNKNYELISEVLIHESVITKIEDVLKNLHYSISKKKKVSPSVTALVKQKDKAEATLVQKGIMKKIDILVPMTQRMLPKIKNKNMVKAISTIAVANSIAKKTNEKTELIELGSKLKNIKKSSIDDETGDLLTGSVVLFIVLIAIAAIPALAAVAGPLVGAALIIYLISLIVK